MNEYLKGLVERYDSLTEEERSMVQGFLDTEVGQVVAALLGPELAGLIQEVRTKMPPEPDFLQG